MAGRTTMIAGILIGVLGAVWIFFCGFMGWHDDPGTAWLFNMGVLIQIGVLVWGLIQTARTGRRYWRQVGTGTLMSALAAVIIVGASLVFTTVAFPHFLADTRAMQVEMWQGQGLTAEQIEAAKAVNSMVMQPVPYALIGGCMTVLIGFLASLVIAAFARSKT